MNQVCCLSKLGRSGWGGFEKAPPTQEDVIRAIENLDPAYKGIREVISIIQKLKFTNKTCRKRAILENCE